MCKRVPLKEVYQGYYEGYDKDCIGAWMIAYTILGGLSLEMYYNIAPKTLF